MQSKRIFNSPLAIPAHGLLGLARVFHYDLYSIMGNACLLALYICATTHGPTSLTRALFFGTCHCSYIFVPYVWTLVFMLQVT